MGVFEALIGLIMLICAIWVIYDVVTKQKRMKDGHKLAWIICAIIFSIITAIVYYFMVKQK